MNDVILCDGCNEQVDCSQCEEVDLSNRSIRFGLILCLECLDHLKIKPGVNTPLCGEPCTTKEDIKELVEYYKNIIEMNEQLSAVRKDCAVRAETFNLVITQIEEIINNNSL